MGDRADSDDVPGSPGQTGSAILAVTSNPAGRMLAPLLATLRFRCNNRDYRPVMDAIELLARYTGAGRAQRFYAPVRRCRSPASCPGRGRTPSPTSRLGASSGSRTNVAVV
jgi:hypothetical protein